MTARNAALASSVRAGRMAGEPCIVVSPHLDDGVFSCGRLLAARPGSVVITVFAGRPPRYDGLTEWDAASGFGPGDDPVLARREEDRAALSLLSARPVWLEFCDDQYESPPSRTVLDAKLEAAILAQGMRTICLPLGLFHSDHRLTHDATVSAMRRHPELEWLAYADAIYRRYGNLLTERLAELAREGLYATPVDCTPAESVSAALEHRKRLAVGQYRSQHRALTTAGRPGYADAFTTEQLWRLSLPLTPSAADRPHRRERDV